MMLQWQTTLKRNFLKKKSGKKFGLVINHKFTFVAKMDADVHLHSHCTINQTSPSPGTPNNAHDRFGSDLCILELVTDLKILFLFLALSILTLSGIGNQ